MLDHASREGWPFTDQPVSHSSPPTPLFAEGPPAEPYPAANLGPLQEVAQAISEQTQAPDTLVAQCCLAAASLATQHLANVETLGGPAPLSLFYLTVAESGERKSACQNIALPEIHALEKARLSAFQTAKDTASEVLETPSLGLRPQILLNDPTIEGLLRDFREGQPSIGIFSYEGGQLLGGTGLSADNKVKSGAAFSKLWDGKPLDRARAGGDSPETYHDRRAALHLMVQPLVADRFLSDKKLRDQGLLWRMLVAFPESKIGTRLLQGDWRQRHVPPAISAYHARIRTLLETEPGARDRSRVAPRFLPLSDAAADLLVTFYNRIEQAQAPGGGLTEVKGGASKAAENACRIAGVLTLLPI